MFTVMKVRPGLAAGDYADPGWYRHPEGTVAYEWAGDAPSAASAPNAPAPGDKPAAYRVVDPRRRTAATGGMEH